MEIFLQKTLPYDISRSSFHIKLYFNHFHTSSLHKLLANGQKIVHRILQTSKFKSTTCEHPVRQLRKYQSDKQPSCKQILLQKFPRTQTRTTLTAI